MITLFWHRRDLRSYDNNGLFEALKNNNNVLPIFIFDKDILSKLSAKDDKRVTFIWDYLKKLKEEYNKVGSDLYVFYGSPKEVFNKLISVYTIKNVYTNYDCEPDAIKRDKEIESLLHENNIDFYTYKDHTICDKNEVLKDDGKPYTVYTPYMKKYKSILTEKSYKEYNCSKYFNNLSKLKKQNLISLEEIGFKRSNIEYPKREIELKLINNYEDTRDIPSIKGTSRLSVHLRFGTLSIRELFRKSYETENPDKFTNELIWRDFYMMILFHFPKIVDVSFKSQYDKIKWLNNEEDFEKWKVGKTGYPLVDAGMRELNKTGFMHNRVRMVVASFLTKHLLIDWRWGERFFAEKLLDFELSSNVGGWQWAAGCGCDAAPYFRVFNPELQRQKFDPENIYILKWVPELNSINDYPKPIVEHKFARDRALKTYKDGLNS